MKTNHTSTLIKKDRFKIYTHIPIDEDKWPEYLQAIIIRKGASFIRKIKDKIASECSKVEDNTFYFGKPKKDKWDDEFYELEITLNSKDWTTPNSSYYDGLFGNGKYLSINIRHKTIDNWYDKNFWGKLIQRETEEEELELSWLHYQPFRNNKYSETAWNGTSIAASYLNSTQLNTVDKLEDHSIFSDGTLCQTEHSLFISDKAVKLINEINKEVSQFLDDVKKDKRNTVQNIENSKNGFIKELDKDADGKVDMFDSNIFMEMFEKHQSEIIEIDKQYIHSFIKINKHLRYYSERIQELFDFLKREANIAATINGLELIKEQIKSYDLLLFNALNMLTALLKGDLITFYEIFESFDDLGVFDSKWQKDIVAEMENIADSIDGLGQTLKHFENSVVRKLSKLEYVVKSSFDDLTKAVDLELKQVNSNLKYQNLLSTISAYQLYKINTQTRGLN